MSDLTEFLLARVAEDEMMARAWIDGFGPFGPDTDYLWHFGPTRALAECEAKRRIVEEFAQVHADYRITHTPTMEGQRLGLVKALAFIALPYADHEQFREEWHV